MGQWVGPGIGDVGSYQVAGTPFVFEATTGQTKTATLNYVSSQVIISVGTGGTCTLDFQDSTTGGPETMTLTAGVYHFNIKTTKVKVAAAGSTTGVCVALTNIESKHLSSHDQDDYGTVA